MQTEANAGRLNVVHPQITNANPSVIKQANEEQEGDELYKAVSKNSMPCFKTGRTYDQQNGSNNYRINCHDDSCRALRDPVSEAIVSPNNNTIYHSSIPHTIRVSGILTARTTPADFLAAAFSIPICISSNRKRIPAQK